MDESATKGPEMGPVARLLNVFFAPARLFDSLARRPSWVLPFALLVGFSFAGGWVVTSRVDLDAVVEKQMAAIEERGGGAAAQDEETLRRWTGIFLQIGFVLSTVFQAFVLLFVPALYHGIALAAGKATRYIAVFSAYVHVQMVQLLKGLLLVGVALGRPSVDPEEIPHLVRSNVGAFVGREEVGPVLQALLSQLDLFDFWALGLSVLAVSRVTRFGRAGAAGVVVGVWALYVLCVTALSAVGSAFGGGS